MTEAILLCAKRQRVRVCEFGSMQWAANKGLRDHLIEPGKPWQNETDKSLNSKFREECLEMN
jgi:putative transposase